MVDKNKEFEKIINYSFKNNSLLTKSLTHKSFNNFDNNENIEELHNYVKNKYAFNEVSYQKTGCKLIIINVLLSLKR